MWCSLQCNVSNTLQNWDTQRPYSARLDEQIQGFTEEWDSSIKDENEDATVATSNTRNHPSPLQQHDIDTSRISSSVHHEHPDCSIRLFQYRPAWLEQLVLRVCKIPHVVINSPYAVTEVTGPLPYLQDFDGGSRDTIKDSPPPAMVGRYQIIDEGGNAQNNSIYEYLKLHRGVDLDSILMDDEQQIQKSATFVAILRDTLGPCLMALRYNADRNAWDQIYRSQCISATCGSSNNNNWMCRPILGMWQAWSERVHYISNLTLSQRQQTKETIIETARRAYAIFEHQLKANQSAGLKKQYLLNTDKPTLIDCLLWDHIMQALVDIHLVILLADFPALLNFTQTIWDQYSFGTIIEQDDITVVQKGSSSSLLWIWNMEENAMNAFARIPLLPESKQQLKNDSADSTGIDLIHKFSTLQTDLRKSLEFAKQQRSSTTSYQLYNRSQTWATWHRWRMGGGFLPPNKKRISSHDSTSVEESSRRQYQRNDEIWMMSVVATTVIAMVGFGLVG